MPHPPSIPAHLEPQVLERLMKGESPRQVAAWLGDQGIQTSHASVLRLAGRIGRSQAGQAIGIIRDRMAMQFLDLPDEFAELDRQTRELELELRCSSGNRWSVAPLQARMRLIEMRDRCLHRRLLAFGGVGHVKDLPASNGLSLGARASCPHARPSLDEERHRDAPGALPPPAACPAPALQDVAASAPEAPSESVRITTPEPAPTAVPEAYASRENASPSSTHRVVLTDIRQTPLVHREVRAFRHCSAAEAMEVIEARPCVIAESVGPEEAEYLRERLTSAGATVELVPPVAPDELQAVETARLRRQAEIYLARAAPA